MWHVAFHVSYVTCHMSCTMCKPSHVTCHLSHLSPVANNNRHNPKPFPWKLLNDEKYPIINVGKSTFNKVNISNLKDAIFVGFLYSS